MTPIQNTPAAGEVLTAMLDHASMAQRSAIGIAWPNREDLLRTVRALREVDPASTVPELLHRVMEQEQSALFQKQFSAKLMLEPAARQRVLDIGCGPVMQPCLADVARLARQLDGVDPGDNIQQHPYLTWRF